MMIIYVVILVALITIELYFPTFFGIWDYVSNFNAPSLQNNVVGCTAKFAGGELINPMMFCLSERYRNYDPAVPTVDLGRRSVHWMVKNRKDFNVIYTTKHYSDFLAYSPVLVNYKYVVVVRHPLDRILAMVSNYKAGSGSSNETSWLSNTKIYEETATSVKGELTFKKYINSLTDKDALLYGIYVSSLFFSKEIVELGKIKANIKEESAPNIIRLEDFYNNSKQTLKKISEVLAVDSDAIKSCAPILINNDKKLVNLKYAYNNNYECIHYVYFEKLIGTHTIKDFGYEDDVLDYNNAKRLACKTSKSQPHFGVNLDQVPIWPSFNFAEFYRSFDGYEYKIRKLKRMGGGKYEAFERVDEYKSSNLEIMKSKNSMITSTDIVLLNPAELDQITGSSNLELYCSPTQSISNLSYDQSQTHKYLTYIKKTKEYSNLPDGDKRNRITDDNFPLDSKDSWVHLFCPEVIKYFKDYKVSYFDYYPSDHSDPLTTTEAAITMVCLLKAVDHIAKKVDANWALFVGTQLGALLHGGPIPWDDDIDVIVDGKKGEEFVNQIESFKIGEYKFACSSNIKARRCYIDDSAYRFYQNYKWNHHWPFIDIFFYYAGDEIALEYMQNSNIDTNSRRLNSKVWRIEDFLPFRNTFYGGLMLPTLRLETSMLHYDLNKCFNGLHNHRIDKIIGHQSQVNCCTLAKYFPFIRRIRSKFEIGVELEVLMINDRAVHVSRVNLETGQVINSFYLRIPVSSKNSLRSNNTNTNKNMTYLFHSSE